MRVAIYLADQNPHRDRSLGITRYTESLLAALVDEGLSFSVVTSRSSVGHPGAAQVRLPFRTDNALGRLIADQLHPQLPALAGLGEDVRLYPKGFVPWFGRPAVPAVAVTADVILQHYADRYPQYMSRANLHYFLFGLERTLARASAVVTFSESARAQIEGFCARRGLTMPNVQVVAPATDVESALGDAPAPAQKGAHVVHLASPAPHKRTHHLLSMWQRLLARGRDLPRLVAVGAMDPATRALAQTLPGVEVMGALPEDALRTTLATARALIMPSEIEGFGLPVLEAYYLGTPGCYVTGTAVDEYMSPVSTLGRFDREDVDDFEAALGRVLSLDANAVWGTACRLQERYGRHVLGHAMGEVLRQAADSEAKTKD